MQGIAEIESVGNQRKGGRNGDFVLSLHVIKAQQLREGVVDGGVIVPMNGT
ncbi:MAG: hypothetical protein ABSF62_08635 [Bryobacteraceae bacterium]